MSEEILHEENPSMRGSNPIKFYLTIVFSFVGIGLIVLIPWYIKTKSEKLIISKNKIKKERGIFSKSTNEINHSDVKNIQTEQSFWQRKYNSGNILISSAGTGGVEMELIGYSNIDKIKDLIQSNS